MKKIKLFPLVGNFAENKDTAKEIRIEQILPALIEGEDIILDFENVDSITQSFAHALLSDLIRNYGVDVLDRISFSSCNETVTKILEIVVDYMQ